MSKLFDVEAVIAHIVRTPATYSQTWSTHQLQDFRLSLSPSLQQQDLLRLHLLYTDLLICEAANPPSSDCPLVPPYTRETVPNIPSGFQPLDCYWRSAMNLKSYLEIFSALPLSVCRGLAFPIWTHMLRCIMILYRLSTHPDPAWDCHGVRKMVNFDQILQDLVQLIKRTGIEVGEHSGDDLFARFAEFLHAFQGWVHATFMPGESASGTA
ncbi:hypothetical protein DTO212C5_2798 [Paecilomyces variotii]|nr:hypothetical protein DTO212C5_2798 [Paecilomyces variotii]